MNSIAPREIGAWFRCAQTTAILRPLTSWLAGLLLLSTIACGKDSPVAPTPTPTPTPTATTFTLSGTVTSSSGTAINGATVRINDGANAGKSTTTANGGVFNLTGLTVSGFTLNVTALNYVGTGVPVTLTSNQTTNVQLTPTPLFTTSGTGNTVFDMPATVARVRIQGRWLNRDTSNFVVRISGRLIVNEVLRTTITYDAVHLTGGGGVTEIVSSGAIQWTFTEVR